MPAHTYFAPAERADQWTIARQVAFVNAHPVINGLMSAVGGMIAVLNTQRQVLAVNDALIEQLGIDNPRDALGLRPGEAVACVHAGETKGGCGTTRFCRTCGAAIAMVASLAEGKPVERVCAIERVRDGRKEDLFFTVRSGPIELDGERLLLLFLRDITTDQQRAALERTFFHDISNMLTGLLGTTAVLVEDPAVVDPLIGDLHRQVNRLADEIRIQRCLSQAGSHEYARTDADVDMAGILDSVRNVFAHHSAAEGKKLAFAAPETPAPMRTDPSLLLRVLVNMVLNALEASAPGDEVRISAEHGERHCSFRVANLEPIPPDVALRVFQRNFSTKDGSGRGLGTYSMKLIGERYLGGRVEFTSSQGRGTKFSITLPTQ